MSEEVLSISIRFSSYDGSGKPTYNYTREEEVNSPERVLELSYRFALAGQRIPFREDRDDSLQSYLLRAFFGRDVSKEL